MNIEKITKEIETKRSELIEGEKKISEIEKRYKESTDNKELKEIEQELKSTVERHATNKKEIEVLERQKDEYFENSKNIILSSLNSNIESQSKDITDTAEYREAFASDLKRGDDSFTQSRLLLQRKGIAAKDNMDVLIPKIIAKQIFDPVKDINYISNYCSTVNVKGLYSQPIANEYSDTVHVQEENGACVDATDVTFTKREIYPIRLITRIDITEEMLLMSTVDFLNFIAKLLRKLILRKLDQLILFGERKSDTVKGVRGILTETDSNFLKKVDAKGSLGFETINALESEIETDEESSMLFVMNRRTFYNQIMSLKGEDGHPIYRVISDKDNRIRHLINGIPVIFHSFMKTWDEAAAKDIPILMGDFSAYVKNLPEGQTLTMQVDPYTGMNCDIKKFFAKMFVGGDIMKLHSFVALQKGTKPTPPTRKEDSDKKE